MTEGSSLYVYVPGSDCRSRLPVTGEQVIASETVFVEAYLDAAAAGTRMYMGAPVAESGQHNHQPFENKTSSGLMAWRGDELCGR